MASQLFELTLVRTLNVSRSLVWKAWSEKEHLEKWWCPKPWRAEFTAFDLRAGGAFDSVMFGPNGEKFAGEGSFLEVVPARRVAFTDLLGADWRPLEGEMLGFTAAIAFEDDGAGTRYSARVRHRNAADLKKHEEMGFYDGWSTMLAQLEDYAKSL